MADQSWVTLTFKSVDPEVVHDATDLFGGGPMVTPDETGGTTTIEGDCSYGLAEDVENYLTEQGIAWSRHSDGKYEYDGDEAHWQPGMDAERTFAALNNGGRVLRLQDLPENATDTELGAFVREHFAFQVDL